MSNRNPPEATRRARTLANPMANTNLWRAGPSSTGISSLSLQASCVTSTTGRLG